MTGCKPHRSCNVTRSTEAPTETEGRTSCVTCCPGHASEPCQQVQGRNLQGRCSLLQLGRTVDRIRVRRPRRQEQVAGVEAVVLFFPGPGKTIGWVLEQQG